VRGATAPHHHLKMKDNRDPEAIGWELLTQRQTFPDIPLSQLYDRQVARLIFPHTGESQKDFVARVHANGSGGH
jgi:hypothetical protein